MSPSASSNPAKAAFAALIAHLPATCPDCRRESRNEGCAKKQALRAEYLRLRKADEDARAGAAAPLENDPDDAPSFTVWADCNSEAAA